ncbi:MAPEG family protein [Sphingomonas sp. AOB5]|uniref:MAPEG family protein n=1 Tax=Sphingomonas sp. AOB5 TaxID=3034017 RepID=UPI0023F6678C|nr:MAPEG family protein [Sphingomonas sp. AOB5]MDF7775503.1 MAPEG family protein [Sphingomonas sp. AOB5]
MRIENAVLAWGCVLAFIHIFGTAQVRTRQYGAKWNMGARDEVLPPAWPVVGRMERAQANFFETFPIVIAAVALLGITQLYSTNTAIGALLWLAARVLYLPIYAAGVPVVRTFVFLAGLVGIVMMLWPVLSAGIGTFGTLSL